MAMSRALIAARAKFEAISDPTTLDICFSPLDKPLSLLKLLLRAGETGWSTRMRAEAA
jgi:hypothetical protein